MGQTRERYADVSIVDLAAPASPTAHPSHLTQSLSWRMVVPKFGLDLTQE
jgi:hypothetical protein